MNFKKSEKIFYVLEGGKYRMVSFLDNESKEYILKLACESVLFVILLLYF